MLLCSIGCFNSLIELIRITKFVKEMGKKALTFPSVCLYLLVMMKFSCY